MTPLERLYYPGKDQALKDYAVLDLVRQRQFDVSDSDLTEEDAKELANDEVGGMLDPGLAMVSVISRSTGGHTAAPSSGK